MGVSAAWLARLLEVFHGCAARVVVDNSDTSAGCRPGDSALSDIVAVDVRYRLLPVGMTDESDHGDKRSLSLILKLLPREPVARRFVTEAEFDVREISFYTRVVPDLQRFQRRALAAGAEPLPLPLPQCYAARFPDQAGSLLVLENLRRRGYEAVNLSHGLERSQAEAALRAIAAVHALSLSFKLKENRPLSARYPFLFRTARARDSHHQLVERGLPALDTFLRLRPGTERIVAALNALQSSAKDIIGDLLAPIEPIALLTHTDFWSNNLLFRGDQCVILDWQMATYSRPTTDVALLFVTSLPTPLRRSHTEALLDVYWNALESGTRRLGVDVRVDANFTRADLHHHFRWSQLLALLLCVGSIDVALSEKATAERLVDVLTDLEADGLLAEPPADVRARPSPESSSDESAAAGPADGSPATSPAPSTPPTPGSP